MCMVQHHLALEPVDLPCASAIPMSVSVLQFRGGGIVHGPVPRPHAYKLNRKVVRLGLQCALSVSFAVLCQHCAHGLQYAHPVSLASTL